MDMEFNNIPIENEDGVFLADEENHAQLGREEFTSEEQTQTSEDNESYSEDNHNDSPHKEMKKEETQNDVSSQNTSHSISSVMSVPMLAVTVVASVAVGGGANLLLPQSGLNHVRNFLNRSTQLGFEIEENPHNNYLFTLTYEDYHQSKEVKETNQCIFFELLPNTIYTLNIFDLNQEEKRIYQATYLTKEHDDYSIYLENVKWETDVLDFDVVYQGNDISFVTLEVLDELAKSIYFYEGETKEHFSISCPEKKTLSCQISINGYVCYFETFYQEVIPDEPEVPDDPVTPDDPITPDPDTPDPEPTKTWYWDENYHWHDGDEGVTDLEEHQWVIETSVEPTYEMEGYIIHKCSVCEYSYREGIPALTHHFSEDWAYDSSTHWHTCTDEGYEDLKGDMDTHEYDSSGMCICGQTAWEFEELETQDALKIKGMKSGISWNYTNLDLPSEYDNKPVVDIAEKIFTNGGVENVTIPNSFTHISYQTFYGCSSLVSMSLPFVGENLYPDDVSKSHFFGYIFGEAGYGGYDPCYWVDLTSYGGARNLIPQTLKEISINGGEVLDSAMRGLYYVETISLKNVNSIGEYAFADYIGSQNGNTISKLNFLSIDDSVQSIGNYAFSNNPLETLTYSGTYEQFLQIQKGDDWRSGSNLLYVHCQDGLHTLETETTGT